jgi:predicted transcriptional regulator
VAEAKRIATEVLNGNGGAMLSEMLKRVLVEERGLAKRTVEDALKAMQAEGLIDRRKERRKDGRTWTYFPDSIPAELRDDRELREVNQAR